MTSETSFVENVLKAFKNIIREIEKGSSEHDVRYRFVKYFVEEVLGYEPKYIKWEKKRADLTIIDENDFAVIKIETKRPTESIDKTQHEEQAFKYEEDTTRFIGLTNFLQFKVWEVKKTGSELRLNLDFAKILEQKKLIENLSAEEKSQILFLNNLTKDTLFDGSKYEKFDETYARIDITKDAGFRKLLDRLNFIANNLLLGYTLRAFGEYKEGYSKYQAELSKAERESKNNKENHKLNHSIAKYRQKLEEKYKKYITFSGYELWKQYSGKEDVPDDEVKEIFCKETIYVLLNKLIFIRICEDKGFLEKNISNGGIEELRAFLKKRFGKDVINKEILEMAFKSASGLYSHFYQVGILDWFRTGDGELNELLNRVLWILNQFDFTHVDRDILGNLYEKYLPSGERKRLGEFYTPTEVIDYILTSVGYTYSYDIETKDLLDPACGSGGFLVRASRRLMSRYLMKFRKTDKRELRNPKNWKEIVSRLSPDEAKIIFEAIQKHIYGLDINPFACHIAEMNLLFQIIDLYQKVREKYPDYKLKRFKIYRTDSLEKPAQKQIWDYSHSAFLEEQEEIDAIKNKRFDFVVGNPPYVRVQTLDYKSRDLYKKEYKSAYKQFDLYVLFVERGISWLKDKAFLGYITSNKFLKREYGKEIRKILTNEGKLLQLVDLTQIKIFKEATNDPVISVFRKTTGPQMLKYVEVMDYKENILNHIIYHGNKIDYSDKYIKIINVTNDELIKNNWQIAGKEEQKLISKIKQRGTQLKKLHAQIHEGLITGADDVFVVNEKTIHSLRLESQLLKPVLKGKYIRKYSALSPRLFLIFPYKIEDGKVRLIPENELKNYSNIYAYLSSYKDKLSKRYCVKTKGYEWYSYHDFANPSWFETIKIVTPDISETNNFAIDAGINIFSKKQFYYLTHTCYCINLNDSGYRGNLLFLGILNSKLIEFVFKKLSVKLGKKGYRYITQYLEQLPIKLPSTPEEKKTASQIIKKVDEILELHKSGIADIDAVLEGEETEKLHQLPKVVFSIKDNAKFEKVRPEDSKVYINSEDFVEIKEKKIKDFAEIYLNFNSEKLSKSKDVKNLILNIPIPKSDEILKEIIKKGGADQSQIKEKIKKLEDEINELVYQIYRIRKEERKVVEESL
jgi:type I restriction-modification system DNA methylase subunit